MVGVKPDALVNENSAPLSHWVASKNLCLVLPKLERGTSSSLESRWVDARPGTLRGTSTGNNPPENASHKAPNDAGTVDAGTVLAGIVDDLCVVAKSEATPGQ